MAQSEPCINQNAVISRSGIQKDIVMLEGPNQVQSGRLDHSLLDIIIPGRRESVITPND
jgi:hypothetical protein